MRFVIYLAGILATFGLGYSFFITFSSFLGESCSFGGQCPEFLGVPSCAYAGVLFGFSLFFVLAILWAKKRRKPVFMRGFFWSTLGGMLFSLYFFIQELFVQDCFGPDCPFSIYYPSCLYALFLFVALFGISRYIAGNYSYNKDK